MRCYFCKKEEIEQGHILLVNSPDVANTLVFSCDECSAKNEHVFASCNDCGETVDVGSKSERGGGYIEAILNGNYVSYCSKCAIKMKINLLKENYLIKDAKKVFRLLMKKPRPLNILLMMETIHDRIKKEHPFVDLCVWIRKKQVIISPLEPDDEIIDEINEMLNGG